MSALFTKRIVCFAACAALVCGVLGCGEGKETVKNDSPLAAFDAARTALKKKDYQQFSRNITPASRDAMAGRIVFVLVMTQYSRDMALALGRAHGGGGDDDIGSKEAKKPLIYEILDKHHVDLTKAQLTKKELLSDQLPNMTAVIEDVKNKDEFLADLLAAMEEYSPKFKDEMEPLAKATLTDVKEDGDMARGTIITKKDGKEKREPVRFRKINGTWLVELSMDEPGQPNGESDQ